MSDHDAKKTPAATGPRVLIDVIDVRDHRGDDHRCQLTTSAMAGIGRLGRAVRSLRTIGFAGVSLTTLVSLAAVLGSGCNHASEGAPPAPVPDVPLDRVVALAVPPAAVPPFSVQLGFARPLPSGVMVAWTFGGQALAGSTPVVSVTSAGTQRAVATLTGAGGSTRTRNVWIRGARSRALATGGVTNFGATLSFGGAAVLAPGGAFDVPAGALSSMATIGVSEVAEPTPLLPGLPGPVIGSLDFTPSGLAFAQPARLQMPLPAAWAGVCSGSPKTPSVWLTNDATGAIQTANVQVDCAAKTATVAVPHFTKGFFGFGATVYCSTLGPEQLCEIWDQGQEIAGVAQDIANAYNAATETQGLTDAQRTALFSRPLSDLQDNVETDLPLGQYLSVDNLYYQAWQAMQAYGNGQDASKLQTAMDILGAQGTDVFAQRANAFASLTTDAVKLLAGGADGMGPVFELLGDYQGAFIAALSAIENIEYSFQYQQYVRCIEGPEGEGGDGEVVWQAQNGLALGQLVDAQGSLGDCPRTQPAGWFMGIVPTGTFPADDVADDMRLFELLRTLSTMKQSDWDARIAAAQALIGKAANGTGPTGTPTCGDGQLGPDETCDPSAPGFESEDCSILLGDPTYVGTALCNSTCTGFDTSACTKCASQVLCQPETCQESASVCQGDTFECPIAVAMPVSDGTVCGTNLVCKGGVCDQPGSPPTAPMMTPPASVMEGVAAAFQVQAGVDPDGGEVLVSCASTTGPSSCAPDAPCQTPLLAGGALAALDVVWAAAGMQSLRCATVDQNGTFSAAYAEVAVNVEGVDGGTGAGGAGGASASTSSGTSSGATGAGGASSTTSSSSSGGMCTLEFATAVNYPTGMNPNAMTVADLNGDGRPDLAVANQGSNTVSVLLNNGDGTFAPKVDYPTGSTPFSIAVADLNGDGKPDLVVANDGSDTVSVLLNTSNGTFAAKVDYPTSGGPCSVVATDLNGDGNLDLVVGTGGFVPFPTAALSVLLNNGDGTFAPKVDYITGTYAVWVAASDVNGDGKPDIVVANDGVSVLLGNGDGTLTSEANYAVSSGCGPNSVMLADLNGDGKPDITITWGALGNCGVGSGVGVMLNKGDGTFAVEVDYGTVFVPDMAAAADLNGDGRLDLAAGWYESQGFGGVSILLNNGNGTFVAGSGIPTQAGAGPVAAADLNGDGKPDLAVATAANAVSVFINTCTP